MVASPDQKWFGIQSESHLTHTSHTPHRRSHTPPYLGNFNFSTNSVHKSCDDKTTTNWKLFTVSNRWLVLITCFRMKSQFSHRIRVFEFSDGKLWSDRWMRFVAHGMWLSNHCLSRNNSCTHLIYFWWFLFQCRAHRLKLLRRYFAKRWKEMRNGKKRINNFVCSRFCIEGRMHQQVVSNFKQKSSQSLAFHYLRLRSFELKLNLVKVN